VTERVEMALPLPKLELTEKEKLTVSFRSDDWVRCHRKLTIGRPLQPSRSRTAPSPFFGWLVAAGHPGESL
jgi:hypothetical protein